MAREARFSVNDQRLTADSKVSAGQWYLAWTAHLYTALGLVLAAGIGVCIVDGGVEAFRWAFMFMVAACLVDATDGSYARRLRVKDVLPNFDGAKLDDLIDFLTFTTLPLALIWRAQLLPAGADWLLIFALLASAYGFCQVPAKTVDGYFVGFPSYWNIVAFYLYVLQIPGTVAAGGVVILALLTFVPSYYVYPSRGATLSKTTNFLGGVWVVLLVWILWDLPAEELSSGATVPGYDRTLAIVSLFYPIYYVLISWGITIQRWVRSRSVR
jgi:phosphatidylcholine synthase